jgi:mercuric reductase
LPLAIPKWTAAYEGALAVQNAFYNPKQKLDLETVPWVVFTDPQITGVGIDEKEAEAKGIPFQVTVLPLTEVPRSIVAQDMRGFIKLIRNTETDLLLGARIIAPEGSELIMETSLAIKYKIRVHDLVSTLHPYLTLSEGIKLAALSFTIDVKKMSCCAS